MLKQLFTVFQSSRVLVVAALFALISSPMPAVAVLGADEPAESKVWQGMWRNRKFNTTGPLQCTAKPIDEETWQGHFQGLFMGSKFDYTVQFAAKPEKRQTTLQGKAMLDGDEYEWAGYVRGKVFFGKFRSLKGYYGEFQLKEAE